MELRAGAGGNEATIFARDLKEMYQKYAEHRGWKTRVLDDLTLEISGPDAYDALAYETGVHRVQRVPLTEKVRTHSYLNRFSRCVADSREVNNRNKSCRY